MSPETWSTMVAALDENTDLDALLGALLADSKSRAQAELVAESSPSEQVQVAVVQPVPVTNGPVGLMQPSTRASIDIDAAMHEASARRPALQRSGRVTARANGADLDTVHIQLRSDPLPSPDRGAATPDPDLHEIDAFLDARMRPNGAHGWSTFAPEPVSDDARFMAGGLEHPSRLRAVVRRVAAVATAIGLGVLVVWTVLQ